jgi:hypothetical protein
VVAAFSFDSPVTSLTSSRGILTDHGPIIWISTTEDIDLSDDLRRPPKRRPRRPNSLKHLGDLCGIARTFYEDDRGTRFKVHAFKLNFTNANARDNYNKIQTVDLRRFGIQLIANDRVFHIYEEWPGMDRRRISGSVWDGRAPLSNAPWEGKIRCAHRDWKSARTQLAAWRGIGLFRHGGIGAAWLDDGPDGGALRHLKAQALDKGAPVPLWRQRLKHLDAIRENGGTLGGATSEEKRLATLSKEKLNAGIMGLRDGDRMWLCFCKRHERRELELNLLIGPRPTAHERFLRRAIYCVQNVT